MRRVQAQHGFVELHAGPESLEIGLGHAQDGGVAMGIGIVRAPVAVEDRHIAEPDARLHIGQRDLLAVMEVELTAPHLGAGDPLLGRFAACGR
jgi:hypothetical protein